MLSLNEVKFEPPYDGGSELDITLLRKKGSKVGTTEIMIAVSKGQMKYCPDDECMINIKFDKEKPQYFWGSVNDKGTIFLIRDDNQFLKKLKKAKEIMIEPMFYSDYGQFEFKSENLKWD